MNGDDKWWTKLCKADVTNVLCAFLINEENKKMNNECNLTDKIYEVLKNMLMHDECTSEQAKTYLFYGLLNNTINMATIFLKLADFFAILHMLSTLHKLSKLWLRVFSFRG